jgi:hypothetical protein
LNGLLNLRFALLAIHHSRLLFGDFNDLFEVMFWLMQCKKNQLFLDEFEKLESLYSYPYMQTHFIN